MGRAYHGHGEGLDGMKRFLAVSVVVARWAGAWLLLAWCLGAAAQPAQPVQRESAVKAAFLYRFAGFVDWPTGAFQRAEDPVVIGVWGDDAVFADLEQMTPGRTIEGRPVQAVRIREGEALPRVHVLLVGESRESRVRELAAAAAGPVLVVTQQENGLQLGGVLNFMTVEGRVRFAASLPAAEARGLRLSARLLAVAHAVEGKAR